MALQVWLPGTSSTLLNQGLYKLPNTSYNSMSEFTLGKLGKAIKGNAMYHLSSDIFGNKWSVACWIKFISGYSQYNNIILCLNTSDSEDSKFYLSIVNNTYLNIGRGSSSGVTYTLSGGFIVDTWYHVAATCDGTKTFLYLNGNLVNSGNVGSAKSALNLGIGCRSTNNAGTNITGFSWPMNDIRIYDHCLNPKEVKELSKGLVLHYKLDDQYSESTTNIVRYPTQGSSVGSIGWDVSKHQNAIYVSNWEVGYNSGVSTPAQGYHACWKIIDGLPTMVMVDRNSVIGLSHRWLGISGGISGTMIPSNTIYTVSFDAMSDVQNKQMSSGVYYRQSSSGSYGFHDGCPVFTLSTNWKRYSYTYTIKTVNNISSLYFYGHNGSLEGTVYIRNIQVELKNYATPYVNGTRTATTIYDSSGYQHNGTITGNLSINNDTPRYNYSTQYTDSACSIQIGNLSTFVPDGNFTFNIWFKKKTGEWSSKSYETILGGPSGFELEAKRGGTNSPVIEIYSWGGSSDSSKDIPYSLDIWNMLTMVRTTSNTKFYLNGELKVTGTTGSIPSGNYFIGSWNSATSQNYRGYFSDARIYATALSESDIKELYNTSGYITSNGAVCGYELEENYSNMLSVENYGIETKLWLNGLSSYTQSKCLCTLTDNGYRIYREPNLVYSSAGSVMWGGFVLRNTDNRYGFTKGQTYILQFEVKGLSSNNAKDVYWTNQVGWGGGGLEPQPSNVTIVNPVTLNFNSSEWKTFIYKWTINDEVYKTCTSSYSGFTSGTVYVSYRDFKFGFDYRDTGSLGTDLYIRNIRMYNITDNKNISILKSGVIESGNVVERLDSSTKFLTGNIISTDNLIEI